MPIFKEQIESKVSHKDILNHFLYPYYKGTPIKQGNLISNPLLDRKQATPSFNVYCKNGEWRWKDFAGMDGSAFDLVMELYGVTFPESCDIINQEMNLGLDGKSVAKRLIKKPSPIPQDNRNYYYEIKKKKWGNNTIAFWRQYGAIQDTLEFFNVYPLRSVFFYTKKNKPMLIEWSDDEPMFGYIEDGWVKVYRPYSAYLKHFYVGKKKNNFIFGLKQLPVKGKKLYLVGGEKDVITMYTHEMSAICLNSEESSPINYPDLLGMIKNNMFEEYVVMYDNDKTGLKQMDKICKDFPVFKSKIVPCPEEWVTDISDYYKYYYANNLKK